MMAKTSPSQRAAAWNYIEYLESTQSQASWAAATGYIPLRFSSANTSTIQTLWSTNPSYKVSFDQLASGEADDATEGPLVGPYESVESAVLDGELSMFQQGVSPKQALGDAAQSANTAISQYNARIGS